MTSTDAAASLTPSSIPCLSFWGTLLSTKITRQRVVCSVQLYQSGTHPSHSIFHWLRCLLAFPFKQSVCWKLSTTGDVILDLVYFRDEIKADLLLDSALIGNVLRFSVVPYLHHHRGFRNQYVILDVVGTSEPITDAVVCVIQRLLLNNSPALPPWLQTSQQWFAFVKHALATSCLDLTIVPVIKEDVATEGPSDFVPCTSTTCDTGLTQLLQFLASSQPVQTRTPKYRNRHHRTSSHARRRRSKKRRGDVDISP